MADIVERIKVDMDNSEALAKSKQVEDRLGKMFDKSALKAAAFNQALAIGTRAMGGMVDFLKDGVKSAIEYERTTKQLGTTLRSLGDTGGHWLGVLQQQSTELERLTGTSDEVIRRYQIMALNAGASSDKVDDLVRAAFRLSNAFGMELGSAIKNLIKTQSGLTGELGEAIPWIRDLSKEQLLAGDAIGLVNEKLSTQLTVMTEGTGGAATGLSVAWANLGEEIGKFTTLETSATVINHIADAIQRMADGVANLRNLDPESLFKGYLGSLTAPFVGILGALGIGAYAAGGGGQTGDIPLEPLVTPGAVGGAGPTAGGAAAKRGRGGGFEMTLGEGFGGGFAPGGEDMVYVEGAGFIPQEEYVAHQNLRYDLEATYNEKLTAMREGQVEYFNSLQERETAYHQQQSKARQAINKAYDEQFRMGAVKSAQAAIGAINAFVDGGILGALKFGASMASAFGMQSIASGTAHEALAASLAFIPGMQPAAAGLAATAANEIAVGTALSIGGQIAGAGIGIGQKAASGGFKNFSLLTGSGGAAPGPMTEEEKWAEQRATAERKEAWEASQGFGGGGGGGLSPGSFSGGVGGSSASVGGVSPSTIVINLNGPVYDGAQAGRAIMEKIAEAERQGV